MTELIVTIILIGSLSGMAVIIFRKIPAIAELPETRFEFDWREKVNRIKEKIKSWKYFEKFSLEIFLQKILSKIRILTLKVEHKLGSWLQKLRERAQKKKTQEDDNYWEELKKSKNDK